MSLSLVLINCQIILHVDFCIFFFVAYLATCKNMIRIPPYHHDLAVPGFLDLDLLRLPCSLGAQHLAQPLDLPGLFLHDVRI